MALLHICIAIFSFIYATQPCVYTLQHTYSYYAMSLIIYHLFWPSSHFFPFDGNFLPYLLFFYTQKFAPPYLASHLITAHAMPAVHISACMHIRRAALINTKKAAFEYKFITIHRKFLFSYNHRGSTSVRSLKLKNLVIRL